MTTAQEHEAAIRADIDRDRKYLDYRKREFADAEQALNEREENAKQAALAAVEQDKRDAQASVDGALADRIKRFRFGAPLPVPTAGEVREALDYFGATEDIFRQAWSCVERPDSDRALVEIYRAVTQSAEESAERQAREDAVARLASDASYAEFVAQHELAERLEK